METTNVLIWESVVTLFIICFGSILHFMYEWAKYSRIMGLFSPVNESVWEHLKMGFWSLVLISLFEYPFIKTYINNFFFAKFIGIVMLELVILGIFYTYTAILKKHILIIDVLSYVIGAIICQIAAMMILIKTTHSSILNVIGIAGLSIIGIIFMLFTYITPRLPIFKDKNTGKYGAYWKMKK